MQGTLTKPSTLARYNDPMSITKIARDAGNLMVSRVAWGGSQNFLGAHWVERVVETSPAHLRERVALRFMSFSPHYFYTRNLRAEDLRNRRSRQILADVLVAPYLGSGVRVLDYGCGPGYLAYALADRVAHVYAVDISRGVLACAKTLNGRPNITYQTPEELGRGTETVDVAYSFAVVQHLRTEVLSGVLGLIRDKLRPGGIMLLHFAVPDGVVWRTEAQWLANASVSGRAKLRYGLNCFGRSAAEMSDLVSGSGFTDVTVGPLDGTLTLPGDDIGNQHWLTARRQ